MSYTNCASRISWQFFLSHHSTACLQKNSLTHQRKTPAKTNVCCYSQSIQKLLCDAIAAAKSKELARPKSIPQWHQRLLWLIFSTCLFFSSKVQNGLKVISQAVARWNGWDDLAQGQTHVSLDCHYYGNSVATSVALIHKNLCKTWQFVKLILESCRCLYFCPRLSLKK